MGYGQEGQCALTIPHSRLKEQIYQMIDLLCETLLAS